MSKEKSQEEIQFENMYSRSKSNPWSSYKYPSAGYIISLLYTFTNYNIADNVSIGSNYISYKGKKISEIEDNGTEISLHFNENLENFKMYNKKIKIFEQGKSKYKEVVSYIDKLLKNN